MELRRDLLPCRALPKAGTKDEAETKPAGQGQSRGDNRQGTGGAERERGRGSQKSLSRLAGLHLSKRMDAITPNVTASCSSLS